MKKKVILIILGFMVLTLVFVLTSISKTKTNKSHMQKNTIKEIQKKIKKEKEKKKEDTKESTIAKTEESNQNVNSNDNNQTSNNMATTNKASGNNPKSSSASNSETHASSNVQSSNNNDKNDSNPPQMEVQETTPTVDPNAVDTNHPLYSHHHGEITENCEEKGFRMQIENPDMGSFSCVPVYTVSGGIKGYYLDLH